VVWCGVVSSPCCACLVPAVRVSKTASCLFYFSTRSLCLLVALRLFCLGHADAGRRQAAGVDVHKVAMPFFGAFDGDSDAEESEQHTSAEDQHPDAEEIDDDDQEAPHTDVAHDEKDLPDTADTQIADIPDMPHISHDHAVPDDDVLDKRFLSNATLFR